MHRLGQGIGWKGCQQKAVQDEEQNEWWQSEQEQAALEKVQLAKLRQFHLAKGTESIQIEVHQPKYRLVFLVQVQSNLVKYLYRIIIQGGPIVSRLFQGKFP